MIPVRGMQLMNKTWTAYKKSELLALPVRTWQSDTVYDYLLIVPTRLKHDSGFSCIAVIGCIGDIPIEICAYPDDLELPISAGEKWNGFRMDCSYPSGILRLWSRYYKFQVPTALSSTEIIAVKET